MEDVLSPVCVCWGFGPFCLQLETKAVRKTVTSIVMSLEIDPNPLEMAPKGFPFPQNWTSRSGCPELGHLVKRDTVSTKVAKWRLCIAKLNLD
jgi:hypothetical protein